MLNVCVFTGRLTAAPELKTTPSGVSVCAFSIAVERNQKSKDGEKITDFINIVTWSNTAEFVNRYFCKGQMIAVQGELQTRKFTDKGGVKHTVYEIKAAQVNFCDGGGKPAVAAPQQQGEPVTVTDDDIPF